MSELSLSDLLLAQQLQNQNKGILGGGQSAGLDAGSLIQGAGQLLPMLQSAGAMGGMSGDSSNPLSSVTGMLGGGSGSGEGFGGDTGDVVGAIGQTAIKIAPYIMAALA